MVDYKRSTSLTRRIQRFLQLQVRVPIIHFVPSNFSENDIHISTRLWSNLLERHLYNSYLSSNSSILLPSFYYTYKCVFTYICICSFFHLHWRYHKILRIHCSKSIDYVKFKIINFTCKIFLSFIFDNFFYIIQFKILFSVWGIFKRCKIFDIHQVILYNNDWDYNDHTNESGESLDCWNLIKQTKTDKITTDNE